MPDKVITGYAVIDWRKESIKARKTEPSHSELGSNELKAELKFNVNIPEIDVPTLAADIEVPEPMVHSATLEALEDEDMPDWASTADEVISENLEFLRDAGEVERGNAIDGMTLDILRESRGRPKIENVEQYVREAVAELTEAPEQ